jgi:hypothetical protein
MFFLSVQAFFYPRQIWSTGRRKHNYRRYVFYVFKVSRAAYVNQVKIAFAGDYTYVHMIIHPKAYRMTYHD